MIVVTAIVIMMFLSTLFVLAACMGAARESKIEEFEIVTDSQFVPTK